MKVTLITGAASGLGYEFAKLYAKDNNNLLLIDINKDGLNNVKQEINILYPNINVDLMIADLSDINELKNVYNYTLSKNYFINNLVNNAGFGDRCDFKDMNIDKQITMTNVDCNAVLYFTRVFLDEMLKYNEGHIINVSSIAGFLPGPYMCTYHACKGYVLLLGEAISYELRKTNVKLLTLCPGPFLSNFVKLAHNDYTFEKIKPISAEKVALFGYKKSLKGKSLAIVGFKNRITIFASKIAPRKLVTSSSAKTMKKEK
jgi:short-subunit dehydrogenase